MSAGRAAHARAQDHKGLHRSASRDAPSDATATMHAAPRTRHRRVRQEGAARGEERGERTGDNARNSESEGQERGGANAGHGLPGSARGVPAQSLRRTPRASTGHGRGGGRPSCASPQTRRQRAAEEGAHSTELSARKDGRGREESDSHGTPRGACLAATAREPPDHTTHTSPRPRHTVAARLDARWRGLAPRGPTAHDGNNRPARVKDSHLHVGESALGGHEFSPGAVDDAFRGDRNAIALDTRVVHIHAQVERCAREWQGA